MATRNEEQVAETAAVLLDKIKASAERFAAPADLLALAQAFAVVSDADPRVAKERTGRVWTG